MFPQPQIIIAPQFTPQEYDALMDLMDLGVKAGGLKVATNAAVLAQKLTTALQAAQTAQQQQAAQPPADAPKEGPQVPLPADTAKPNGHARPKSVAGKSAEAAPQP
jgi:hypothetical protein